MKRALVVEDVPDIRDLLAFVIRHCGWEVDAVLSGTEALWLFQPGRYDLVLADINLGGGLDGIAVAQRLLQSEPGLRIVMMSGDSSGDAERAAAAGLGRILVKPFTPDELQAIIKG